MSSFWMVRAGSGGYLINDFLGKSVVAVGFDSSVDLTDVKSREEMSRILRRSYPNAKEGFIIAATGVQTKFRLKMEIGDRVLTYDPGTRTYHIGEIKSDYTYRPGLVEKHSHVREVKWLLKVDRDLLSQPSRNTLVCTLTIFEPGDDVEKELLRLANPPDVPIPPGPEPIGETEVERMRKEFVEKSHEFIKDRISTLDWEEMQELVAAILRGMGFKTRVSPRGPDRGSDIQASPDGLGLTHPRIKVEVKHRSGAMGAPEIRSFIGGIRGEDRGLYVSTGGFTREAQYEAERASVAITLLTLDELARLLVQHYEKMDQDGQALVPLVRFYWPAQS